MTASPQTRNYLYGKGELFFRAVGSEGYDHLGNAPAFTISLTEEKLEHFSSMSGTKTKDLQLVTQKGATVAFTLEEFTTGNILRAAVKAGTPIGRKAKAFMDAGKLVPDAVIIGIALGAVFIVCSKEAREDEMTRSIRLSALLNALYVYVVLLIASTLLINGVAFFQFMVVNLVLLPVIYVVMFRLEMHRYNKMSEDEEQD